MALDRKDEKNEKNDQKESLEIQYAIQISHHDIPCYTLPELEAIEAPDYIPDDFSLTVNRLDYVKELISVRDSHSDRTFSFYQVCRTHWRYFE